MIRDIRNFFELENEENCYRQIIAAIILNTKEMVIEIKQYQLKNILIKFDHI